MADKYIIYENGRYTQKEAIVVSTGVAEAGNIIALDADGLIDLSLLPPISAGTVTSVGLSVPTGLTITGSPVTTSGVLALSFTAGYGIPTTAKQTQWDTAYTNRITSLTTVGTSGAATLIGNTLNVPNYATGSGTVETISIASANGFAGTSDADPADPELTISTTVTGLLKGNGTAISAAVSGTDYLSPANGWKLNGNTVGSGKSIGTLDNYQFSIIANNTPMAIIDGDYNSMLLGYGGSLGTDIYQYGLGTTNALSNENTVAVGGFNAVTGYSGSAFGWNLLAKSFGGTVVGLFNDSTAATSTSSFNAANRAFQIGIGQNSGARENAMTVLFSGKTTLNKYGVGTFTGTPAYDLKVTATGDIIETAITSGTVTGTGTINELAYWTGASSLGTLAVATYPSLTELSYVKGVTSAIQTQLNTKLAGSIANTQIAYGSGTSITGSNSLTFDGTTVIMPANTTQSSIRVGTLEIQSYALSNSWFGDNTYYDGSSFKARATGAGALFYFLGDEAQFKTFPSVPVGTNIDPYLIYAQLKIGQTNQTVALGGNINVGSGNYTGANLIVSGTTASFASDVTVPDEAYGVGWDGSLEVPTKNAIYDKIETISGSSITIGQATLDFGASPDNNTSLFIADVAITGTSRIIASIAAEDTTDNTITDILISNMTVMGGNVSAGVGFTIYAYTPTGIAGEVLINYTIQY